MYFAKVSFKIWWFSTDNSSVVLVRFLPSLSSNPGYGSPPVVMISTDVILLDLKLPGEVDARLTWSSWVTDAIGPASGSGSHFLTRPVLESNFFLPDLFLELGALELELVAVWIGVWASSFYRVISVQDFRVKFSTLTLAMSILVSV